MTAKRRLSYEGVAVAVPVTVPYVRYSTRTAHWFVGQAIEALVKASGVPKEQIDGLCLSSFSLAPDTAVGVTQHLGVLEAANLVVTLWRGREKLHFLNPVPLQEIYERWIAKFEKPRLKALGNLKRRLEKTHG